MVTELIAQGRLERERRFLGLEGDSVADSARGVDEETV
jgi:hypothetical protein